MTIEELEIQIESNAQVAASGLNSLTGALTSLKGATSNSAGLGKVAKNLQALSAVSGFSTEIQKLAATMKPLATEMEKISNGFLAMPTNIQAFINGMNKSGKAASSASRDYKNAASGLDLLASKLSIAGVVAVVHGFRRVLRFMSGFVANANKYVEDINLFTVSMGEYADAAYDYAQKAQELIGIDAGQFMRNQGYFQNMATGFGIAGDQAVILSKNLTMLGYDLASFFNVDIETAMEKLTSGLAGQSRPLREWGFAIEEASLSELALRYNIEGSVRTMSQAEKATLRYIAIMEQSTNAQHDMARTLMTPANQMRIFNQQITLLSRSLGNLLIPVISRVLPYIIAFVKALRMAIDALARLLGVTLPTIDYDAFGGLSTGASAAEDMEDALTGAGAAAKKLKDYVMGFDELNIIRPEDPSGSGGGAGVGAGGGFENIDLPAYDFLDGLSAKADDLVGKMQILLSVIGAITAAILAWKTIRGITNLVDWFNKLTGPAKNLLKIFGGIAAALVSFTGGFMLGSQLTKLFTGQIEGFTWQMGLGVAMIIAGTVALGHIFGPIGVFIGLLAAVTGAMAGVSKELSKLRSERISASFFDGQGVAIGYLADEFVRLMDAITNANQPIIDGWNTVQAGQESVASVSREFGALRLAIQANVADMETAIPDMIALIEQLEKDTKGTLYDIRDNIVYALSGSFGDSLESMGESRTEMVASMYGITDAAVEMVDTITAELDMYNQKLSDTGNLSETEWTEYFALIQQLNSIVGNNDQTLTNFASALEAANSGIDWGSASTAEMTTALERMGSAYTASEKSIKDNTEALRDNFEVEKNAAELAGDVIGAENVQKLIDALPAYEASQLNALNSTLTQYMNVMQTDLANEMQSTWNTALSDFDTLGMFEQWLYGSAETYAANMLNNFETDIINPFVKGIETNFPAAVAESTWVDKLAEELDRSVGMALGYAEGDVTTAILTMFKNSVNKLGGQIPGLTESLGNDFVDGFLTPIEAASAADAAGALVRSGLDQIPIEQDSGSPSRITEGYGRDFVDGFAQEGILGNVDISVNAAKKLGQDTLKALADSVTLGAHAPVEAFKHMLNQMLSAVSDFSNSVANAINQTLSNMANAFNSTQARGRTVSAGSMSGTHAAYLDVGMDYVPHDNFPAYLHAGESVLTATDASLWRAMGGSSGLQSLLAGQVNSGAIGPDTFSNSGSSVGFNVNTQQNKATITVADIYEAFSMALQANAGLFEQGDTVVQLDGRTIFEENIRQDQTYGYTGFRKPVVNLG